MNTFDWIPFYSELAEKLVQYRFNRAPLLSWIYDKLDSSYTSYLHDSDGEHLVDIDPFTVMGIFNRLIKSTSRIEICKAFKGFLKIETNVPTDFSGIPVLNNMKSQFFGFKEKRGDHDIRNLWNLFVATVDESNDVENAFDIVRQQYGSRVNITMGLFWISPFKYVALDRLNRSYMLKYGIKVKNTLPKYSEYIDIIKKIQNKMESAS